MTETITPVASGGRDQDFLAPAARLRGAGIGGLEELTDVQRSERLARMRDGSLGSIPSWELGTAVVEVPVLPQSRYLPHEGRGARDGG